MTPRPSSRSATGSASASSSACSPSRPLVLPEFWRRFVTEILIWGLLAMSSDILIGYTGMVSFGHSAFFGLGMYGAAAALLTVKPPNLWLAMLYGLVGRAACRGLRRLLRHAAARHLLLDHDARLLADLLRHHLHVDGGDGRRERPDLPPARRSRSRGSSRSPSRPETLHWFVLGVVTASYLILRRITQSPFGMVLQSIRENEPRTRAIGYHVERYKMVAVMLSGCFAGLAGVLYAHPEQVRRAGLRLLPDLRRGRHLQRDGRRGHAGGPDRRRGVLPPAPRGLSRASSPSTT